MTVFCIGVLCVLVSLVYRVHLLIDQQRSDDQYEYVCVEFGPVVQGFVSCKQWEWLAWPDYKDIPDPALPSSPI